MQAPFDVGDLLYRQYSGVGNPIGNVIGQNPVGGIQCQRERAESQQSAEVRKRRPAPELVRDVREQTIVLLSWRLHEIRGVGVPHSVWTHRSEIDALDCRIDAYIHCRSLSRKQTA